MSCTSISLMRRSPSSHAASPAFFQRNSSHPNTTTASTIQTSRSFSIADHTRPNKEPCGVYTRTLVVHDIAGFYHLAHLQRHLTPCPRSPLSLHPHHCHHPRRTSKYTSTTALSYLPRSLLTCPALAFATTPTASLSSTIRSSTFYAARFIPGPT